MGGGDIHAWHCKLNIAIFSSSWTECKRGYDHDTSIVRITPYFVLPSFFVSFRLFFSPFKYFPPDSTNSILTCVNSLCFIPVSLSVCPNVLAPLRRSSSNIIISQWIWNPSHSVILSNLHKIINISKGIRKRGEIFKKKDVKRNFYSPHWHIKSTRGWLTMSGCFTGFWPMQASFYFYFVFF